MKVRTLVAVLAVAARCTELVPPWNFAVVVAFVAELPAGSVVGIVFCMNFVLSESV